jgi:Fic family protein
MYKFSKVDFRMKWIETPPDWTAVIEENPDLFFNLISKPEIVAFINHMNDKYYHWDELKYRQTPDNIDKRLAWALVKFSRTSQPKNANILSIDKRPFWYWIPDVIHRELHFIDKYAVGQILTGSPDIKKTAKDKYIVSSLMEEAIASSILEGAATTHKKAKEMLLEGRKPRTRGEIMIKNNYTTMVKIKDRINEKLSIELLCDIQESITKDTLSNASASGSLRRSNDIVVADYDGTVLHIPPDASEIKERLNNLCNFANSSSEDTFIHPVVKASILHFSLGYIHPFEDGNGRTARALFYWYLLKNNYWLVEFLPISRIILKSPSKYKMAYIYSERDDNDLTYFLRYNLRAFRLSIEDFTKYISRKQHESQEATALFRKLSYLNHRQQELIVHAIYNPDTVYTINRHKITHGIVYQTARNDLWELVKDGLLTMQKVKKLYNFLPATNLKGRLKQK